MSGNIISIFDRHDANISFYHRERNQYYIIELERFLGLRYYSIEFGCAREILEDCQDLATRFWGIENDYEAVLITPQWKGSESTSLIKNIFNSKKYLSIENHHYSHATCGFYQSPFDEALILSYDGGGMSESFNLYKGDIDGVKLIKKLPINIGAGYWMTGSLIKEIIQNSKLRRSYPGKLMGLSAYGKFNEKKYDTYCRFMNRNKREGYEELYELDEIPDDKYIVVPEDDGDISDSWVYESQEGYDIAYTIQKIIEKIVFFELEKCDSNIPLILTGGCALNVVTNEKLKEKYDRPIYIPPNPHDGGLSLGHIFAYEKPKQRVNVTYSGLPLMDQHKLEEYVRIHNAVKVNKKDIAELIKDGKIVGLVYGDSEVGPRALGNRSIVCDPNIADMKDILNSKVKFREWYRPFAPFCKKEDAHKYFESRDFENMEYMSFAVKVKVDTLPSITHVDGTARLQTVTEESHSHFYELLTEFGKISDTNVLLNTSFNTRGKPILSTIYESLKILRETELDYVVVEDYLFS